MFILVIIMVIWLFSNISNSIWITYGWLNLSEEDRAEHSEYYYVLISLAFTVGYGLIEMIRSHYIGVINLKG